MTQQESFTETIILPCDRRYRTSKYFLADQLRCSEAAEDFRSIKDLLNKTQAFSMKGAFRFQALKATVPVRADE